MEKQIPGSLNLTNPVMNEDDAAPAEIVTDFYTGEVETEIQDSKN